MGVYSASGRKRPCHSPFSIRAEQWGLFDPFGLHSLIQGADGRGQQTGKAPRISASCAGQVPSDSVINLRSLLYNEELLICILKVQQSTER